MRRQMVVGLIAAGLIGMLGTLYALSPRHSGNNPSGQDVVQPIVQSGAITGRVVNAEGQLVAGAEVFVRKSDSSRHIRRSAYTNQQGEFTIDELTSGVYMVYGIKETEGYSRTDSAFHLEGDIPEPQATVFDGQVTGNIVVQLGPKAAYLVGRIVDSITNQPINDAIMYFRRVDNPASLFITGPNEPGIKEKGGFKILVPSAPFTLEVKAPGYEIWTYSSDGSGKHKDALKLEKEETKNLKIALRPVK